MIVVIVIGIFGGLVLVFYKMRYGRYADSVSSLRKPDREFPYQWQNILEDKVMFYRGLSKKEKEMFDYKVHVFLLNVRIIGMQTEVSHEDRVLVAAGAVIPIFRFKQWYYKGLVEVHLYPDKFQIPNNDKMANGLVGWGAMEGKMMLSKKALHLGFDDPADGKNIAIHEFVHLFDKADGEVDSVLESIMDEDDIEPWLYIMQSKMKEINEGKSDIRPYGGVNQSEFLAVVSEYFFEKPEQMKTEHPGLYNALDSFFNPPKELIQKFKYTSKYDPCPCGSGNRFEQCCMKHSDVY